MCKKVDVYIRLPEIHIVIRDLFELVDRDVIVKISKPCLTHRTYCKPWDPGSCSAARNAFKIFMPKYGPDKITQYELVYQDGWH
jgi:hypothetical protein